MLMFSDTEARKQIWLMWSKNKPCNLSGCAVNYISNILKLTHKGSFHNLRKSCFIDKTCSLSVVSILCFAFVVCSHTLRCSLALAKTITRHGRHFPRTIMLPVICFVH